jgi:uncharacterized damage-inducible protein DinB
MTALTGEELQAWVEHTTQGWRQLVAKNPQVLSLPCDVRETQSVAQLLQHIVAVELRYAQRLRNIPQSDYSTIPYGSAEEIFATHDRAMELLQGLPEWSATEWEEVLEFPTRSAGPLRASRRTILVHLSRTPSGIMRSLPRWSGIMEFVQIGRWIICLWE